MAGGSSEIWQNCIRKENSKSDKCVLKEGLGQRKKGAENSKVIHCVKMEYAPKMN